jgi:tetratricopeptide (TPR) repeat protein
VDGARAAYQQAIDSGHADAAPMAAFGLGGLLADHSDVDGARAAYQQAIDSGHADQAPSAALNLGVLLREQGMWTVRGPPTSRPSTPVTLVPLPERQLASVFFWPSTAI